MARWINWSPTGGQEVAQNVRQLLKTAPGTVPLSRAMGTPQDVVDEPMGVAGALLSAEVARAVRTFEPRAKIRRVRLVGSADGMLDAVAEMEGDA